MVTWQLVLLIVVTNQPDVARGTQTREVVEAMHAFLQATLPITETMTCYEDGERCPDRKPNPGMLLKAAALYDIDLSSSFMAMAPMPSVLPAVSGMSCRGSGLNSRKPASLRSVFAGVM
jgi:D-glycero-D-manno-heptose 1,7-bisphosphate phosphatase